ncbi:helix-turn-helix domain-containing protein [Burkholderia multivorans]|uniref:helix-turn-helix transcriptional regulator n=1 Tax=Burkholderia multivorans TaxID=87883 RepID=UPI0019077794|nr:helix-turn-helix domain-containing protein [Burkholderia multivorans]MBJ9654711.1 helix-turn-helix domain-containing protein [Burkholderia multivorans]MBR8048729.1 helix-turn-helix domain-containing protein [Burkholderia multivorans]MBU9528742.1 helix-turn-helix domain-containing protein [Burkholderia multivorans]MCA8455779.1 helix-turn-helix domain-containing protein [Burkholderia multivorans]MCO1359406.1 helix-turn-helix domain-containing protein [Burkholderia multivorans]
MQQLLTPKALAAFLGLAVQTIYNRHSSGGDLPKAIKIGRRLRFHPRDVDAWVEVQRQPSAETTSRPSAELVKASGLFAQFVSEKVDVLRRE